MNHAPPHVGGSLNATNGANGTVNEFIASTAAAKSIIVGPHAHQAKQEDALHVLAEANGPNFTVRLSGIPFHNRCMPPCDTGTCVNASDCNGRKVHGTNELSFGKSH